MKDEKKKKKKKVDGYVRLFRKNKIKAQVFAMGSVNARTRPCQFRFRYLKVFF